VTALTTDVGASSFEVRCPAGSVGVGYEGRHGDWIDQVRLLCAELRADGTLGALAVTDSIGSSAGGSAFNTECAPDSLALTVLVGARGSYSIVPRRIGSSQGQCLRPADVAAGVANDASVRTTATAGGTGTVFAYALFCPHGSAVTGLRGQEDAFSGFVAAIGLICREVHDG
jgi:hypothetical protein